MLEAASYQSLGELLSDAWFRWKKALALLELDRGTESRRLSYEDMQREAARVASWLCRLDLSWERTTEVPPHPGLPSAAKGGKLRGPRIGIVLSNQSRWLIAASAVFRCGGILVPIDPKLAPEEQSELLAHAQVELLITEKPLLRRWKSRPPLPTLLVDGEAGEAGPELFVWDTLPEAPMPPLAARKRSDIATIVYSSGTGGRPKGCMLSHGAYLSQLEALMALYPLRPGHRVLSILPTNHAIDFMVGFIGPLACGASVVHQRTLRPEFILSTLREHAITHTAFVPALLEAIERSFDEELNKRPKWQRTLVDGIAQFNRLLGISPSSPTIAPLKRALGDHLEIIFAGGAFVDPRRAERFYALGLPVVIGYGLTECCTVATLQDMHPFRADSVGRPLPGIEVRIAPLSGSQLDEDGVGEVWIRGPTLMSGYLDDPELTQATITEDGWLRTGDLGWLDASHHLHLVGRIKNMIVTPGGKNVYPEDIEKAFEGIPQVDELCVFASGYVWPRRHHLTQEVLFAVVRSRLEPEHLRSELAMRNRNLPEHKRIQAFVLWRDPFPRTASLKIKREPLAQALRERVEPGGSGWMPLITTSSSPCAFSELRSARASENGQSRRDGIRVAGHHQS